MSGLEIEGAAKPGSPPASNAWRSIWFRPRTTIRFACRTEKPLVPYTLVVAFGTVVRLGQAADRDAGVTDSLLQIIGTSIVTGWLHGLISLYLGGALLLGVGKLLGGKASGAQIRSAVTWSWAPYGVSLALWSMTILFFGREMFYTAGPDPLTPSESMLLLSSGVGLMLLWAWSVVLLLFSVAEVQSLTFAQAVVNVFGAAVTGILIFRAIDAIMTTLR